MKRMILMLLSVATFSVALPQAEDITSNPRYIFGIGEGRDLEKADKEALADLISQISIEIHNETSLKGKSVTSKGKEHLSEEFRSLTRTYSTATLTNVERRILSKDGDRMTKVMRYIHRDDKDNLFKCREALALEHFNNAKEAEKKQQIGNAIKYYYWSYALLQSLPRATEISAKIGEKTLLLAPYIPAHIGELIAQIHFTAALMEKDKERALFRIKATYQDKPLLNLNFTYYTGNDWSGLFALSNGSCVIDMPSVSAIGIKELRIKVDYKAIDETISTKELYTVMEAFYHLNIPCEKRVSIGNEDIATASVSKQEKRETAKAIAAGTNTNNASQLAMMREVKNTTPYKEKIERLTTAIRSKQYDTVNDLFTPNGADCYTQLVKYGKATVLPYNDIRFYTMGKEVVARTIPMVFSFAGNSRKFTEQIVITFDTDGKIDALDFALDGGATRDIAAVSSWKEEERLTVISFLEHFKTAYALKRLDYIQSIYADDAYIITGRKLQKSPTQENTAIIQNYAYNQQSKKEYMTSLQNSFKSKEYINIKFEDCVVESVNRGGEKPVYAINMAQRYFSNNYGDFGYLRIVVDYSENNCPQIKVRVWSPVRNPDGTLPK